LVITEAELRKAIAIIGESLKELPNVPIVPKAH
jgi:hypothetical protein